MLNYDEVGSLLMRHKILTEGSELQGVLCGMLAGGMKPDNDQWLATLEDMFNQQEAFPPDVTAVINQCFVDLCADFAEADFGLILLLPDDGAPINERGAALRKWVEGFLAGFGFHQSDLNQCSTDVREALRDFSEILKMDDDMDGSEEEEIALVEVEEYVRMSAMLCFSELNPNPGQTPSDTLH